MTPSAKLGTSGAWSGVVTPMPTHTGCSVRAWMRATSGATAFETRHDRVGQPEVAHCGREASSRSGPPTCQARL